MAVRVTSQPSVQIRRPYLYTVDVPARPALSVVENWQDNHPTIVLLRRRRLFRRLRRAGEAVGWAAASAALLMVVLSALAGLR